MNLEFLIGGVLSAIVVAFLAYGFIKNYKNPVVNKATNQLSILSFGYFGIFLFSFLWLFGILSYGNFDFEVIYAAVILLQTLVLFKVFHVFAADRKHFYLLLFYLAAFLPFAFSSFKFLDLLLVISFLLTLILALSFMKVFVTRRNAVYTLIVYSLISLFSVFVIFLEFGNRFMLSLASCFLFALFCYYFFRDVDKYPSRSKIKELLKEESKAILFVKYFIYVIVVVNLVLISTIGVHEFGHVVSARYFGCESRTIVFEENSYPYSEILCNDGGDKFWIALAGPILPILIALILMLFSSTLLRPISFLVIGFNLIAAYKDFLEVGASPNLTLAGNILGGICLISGIVLLSRGTIKQNE